MNNKGIALVQVLLLSAIMSVFALYLTKSSREQVTIASWANDRAMAEVKLNSVYSDLLFTLFTYERAKLPVIEGGNELTEKWNFHNQPFSIDDGVEIKIQDLAGKIGIHFLDVNRLKRLLISLGIDDSRSSQIIDRLLDWQDADNISLPLGRESSYQFEVRNGYIPDITDLYLITELTEFERKLLIENTTIYFNGSFNPLTASKELLMSETDQNAAEQIVSLRNSKDISPSEYRAITGKPVDSDIHLYPSATLQITLEVKVGQAQISKEYVINLKRYNKGILSPLNTLFKKG